ncbi:glycosyl transferase [Flexivirga endophytica]|uniref:D-inositol 3-phosphate glycosyltransferase n=2 Tax=Flexivirga endophytica TaxID=1849103 RepID=A0A916X1J6_9MICO|nr:glycosyl transferase [Flexivirga endophytica]GHB67285.1 glycosyl transferase [Flexivirga endophytica]
MKVALLSDCYPPRLGGIEVQVHGLARALVRGGHAVEVFTITPGQVPDDGFPVHRLGLHHELPGGLLVNPRARAALRKTLQHSDFDVVHAHLGVVSPFAMDGVVVALGAGLPVAATWHSVTGRSEPIVRALGYTGRWARQGVALSAVSRVAATPLERVAGAEVSIVPNGIDNSFWCAGDERALRGNGTHVVSAMRLAARKRPQQLVDMVQRARAMAGQDIRLTIAGDGPLHRRLDTRRPPWCQLPGRLSPTALRDLYRSADVYAAPAVLEAFGIAAAEARSCGLPVVTRAESAVADLVEHERTGLVVADDREFASALARMASDPALRERLSSYGRSVAPAFGWDDVLATVIGEYDRARRSARH